MTFKKVFTATFIAVLVIDNGASYEYGSGSVLWTSFGAPVDSLTSSLTAGPQGPVLLQDTILIDQLAHFNRERIPERTVHAKGGGAFGYFECTHDVTKYTKLIPFSKIGKRTDVAVRFSRVIGESGTADTVRDPRGFAIKFYTEDGIWDIVGFSFPVFFVRDPMLFPSFIHAQKRDPVTHLRDDSGFDFDSLRPETTNANMYLFSDVGIPDGFRHMDGFGINTFKLVNKQGIAYWCKFHFKTNQQVKNLFADKAAQIASQDPDYSIRDLYNAIDKKDYPSWTWTTYIQIMTYEQAEKYKYDPFDATKIWPTEDFPLIEVGKLVLNRNPINYFAQVEQMAFDPSHMIPGVEPSPDKLLQGRLFAYGDAQRYRLGANHLQLPVNCPFNVRVTNYQRDGASDYANYSLQGAPNYFPNSFGGPQPNPRTKISPYEVSGKVYRYESGDYDNYSQAAVFWNNLSEGERFRLVQNIVSVLKPAHVSIQKRVVNNFSKVNINFGYRLKIALSIAKV
ncbi:catalase-like [Planococcus citri]|uniref:catalase-like n=1 Tax=Planococcus citri TaxID=170843 RepID=UPI0031F9CA08